MRIAIPLWEDKVSPVLDTAARLLVIEVKNQKEASRFETNMDEEDLSRRCYHIRGLAVDTLICGAISRPFSRMLLASGIDIIPEISGPIDDILDAYLQGNLFHSRFLMPGCKRLKSKRMNKQRRHGEREEKNIGKKV